MLINFLHLSYNNLNFKDMKKNILLLIIIILLIPKQVKAQEKAAGIVAAVAATGVLLGLAISEIKEQAELIATQWVLANHPEITSFNLKVVDFDGKKAKDMSSTSIITFNIHEFTPKENPVLDGKKHVLFGFTSYGWVNEYGIDFNKVRWYLIDSNEWLNMMLAYTKVASPIKDDNILKEALKTGQVDNKGIKLKGTQVINIPFYKLNGDSYLVTDYSPEMKFIYNEKSFCIFFKKTNNLVQMSKQAVIETHNFLFFD